MARRDREKKTPLTAEQKKLARRARAEARKLKASGGSPSTVQEPRERRSRTPAEKTEQDEENFRLWMKSRTIAAKIMNDERARPYIASILWSQGRSPPVVGYFPVSYHWREGRYYFHFLMREHRDGFYRRMKKEGHKPRKHFTPDQ